MGDRHVITAAHCIYEERPDNLTVLIGETTLGVANDKTAFIRNVSEIIKHSKWNETSIQNDIAVLVLSSPVDLFTYPNIKPACLPTTETKADMYGRNAVVSGWGRVGRMAHGPSHGHSHLQELRSKILPYCGNYKG